MAKKKATVLEISTEEKIKSAAAKLFQQKGFAATRTRDIADEAEINLALLNYYFRSKKNLFEIIMAEKLVSFFSGFILNKFSEATTLDEKVKLITKNYIHLLLENPDLPLFVLNAIQNDPKQFADLVKGADLIQQATIAKQLKTINPKLKFEQFFLNILSLCVFPFIMKPAISIISKSVGKDFEELMKERIKLIPIWIDSMIQAK